MLTIGIVSIGSDLTPAAKLYHAIVEYCTVPKYSGGAGCVKDQDHPPAINVSLLPKNPRETEQSFNLAKYLGADFFAVAEHMTDEQLADIVEKTGLKVFSLKKGQTLIALAKEVADYALTTVITDPERLTRGNLSYARSIEHVDKSLLEFTRNISTKKSKIIGAITGAGPIAGSVYGIEMATAALPSITVSYTIANDKNDATCGTGPDYAPDYIRIIKLLDPFVDCHTIACNTAHDQITVFKAVAIKPFLDIRDASLEFLKDNFSSDSANKKIILLGTPATMQKRLYHQRLIDAGYKIIEPNPEQLHKIYKVIYQVKGNIDKSEGAVFDLENAKENIMAVANEMRDAIGDKYKKEVPVLLGCTELNVPFSSAELSRYALLSTTSSLVVSARNFSRMQNRGLLSEKVESKEENLSQVSERSSDSSDSSPVSPEREYDSPLLSPMPPSSSIQIMDLSRLGSVERGLKMLEPTKKRMLTALLIEEVYSYANVNTVNTEKRSKVQYTVGKKNMVKSSAMTDEESEVSDDDNTLPPYVMIIEHLTKDTNVTVTQASYNKIKITLPQLKKTETTKKINSLKEKFGSNSNIRLHSYNGFISCDINPSEISNLRDFLSVKGLKLQAKEQESGASR